MERQYTSTVYIISEERVLLIFHRKFQMWLPPGGHVDPNELPSDAAKREVLEETGLEIEFISDEHVWIDQWNAKSLPRPFMCLLEEIPAFGTQSPHQHIDMIYVGKPVGGKEIINETELADMRWFTLEEVELLVQDVDTFQETKEAVRKILQVANVTADSSTNI